MDDYSDLVTASLTLVSAGIMLVAGQLYIENRSTHPGQRSRQDGQPALVSSAPSSTAWRVEPRRVQKRRAS
jgi:hypothetical protein